MECDKDHVVFKEGDVADKVYIILEGEFLCSKLALIKAAENTCEGPNQELLIKNRVKYDNHFVASYYIGKMLGELDILSEHNGKGSGRYTSTVKCNSTKGKLIFIRKVDFLKL